jgi:hypothetical protein
MYLMDADSGTAMWASDDQNQSRGRRRMCLRLTAIPKRLSLPYGNTPKWLGAAEPLPVSPPRIDLLEFRSDGDATVVEVRVASPGEGR